MTVPESCGYSDHFHDIEHVFACSMCGAGMDGQGESLIKPQAPPVEGAVSQRYVIAKRVVENKQYEFVEGTLLDLFTASAMVAVFEAIKPDNQAKFDKIALAKLVDFCFRSTSSAAKT